MIFFKRKNNHAERLNQLHFAVAHSFNKVKEDSATMFEWISYLHQQNAQQHQLIQDLHFQLNNMPTTKEAVKHVIDNYYSFEPVMAKIRELDEKIEKIPRTEVPDLKPEMNEIRSEMRQGMRELRSELRDEMQRKIESVSDGQKPVLERLRELASKVESLEKKPARPAPKAVSKEDRISNLRERIVKKVVRRSKDYVKSMLLKWISKYERVPAMELREMIVDDQQLCSKSSFYRLLQELEDNGLVDVVSDGKEKIYLAKQLKESIH